MFLTIKTKRQNLVLLSFFILLIPSYILAHNPSHSSTMLVEGENNEWTLLISSSLTAYQHEIREKYAADSYKTPEEFKEMVTKHLLENLSIICDNEEPVKLEPLAIKLGHATKIIFKAIGLPKTFTSIRVKNSSFKNLSRNQSALIILKKGIAKKQFILNKENNYSITLNINKSSFEHAINQNQEPKSNYTIWAILSFLIIVIIVYFKKRKNIKS